MPFPMKIQPIDDNYRVNSDSARLESSKPVQKSRLKRLLDRPFTNALRSSTSDKSVVAAPGEAQNGRDRGAGTEFEPTSVCLANMVQSYMEESNEKQAKYGRNRCNCFNGNNDSSDDDFDLFGSNADSYDAFENLKSLIPCASTAERNLLADTAKIVEKNKSVKRKDDMKKFVINGLSSLGYDSSICKSKWEKSPSIPAGEYEYIDVIVKGERLLIDVDFPSEFEIARQTNSYKALLQSLPFIFVGKSDRLRQIVTIISEAAKQSLKKKSMHLPPWRKADYMRAKWLSPYTRASGNAEEPPDIAAAAVPKLDCSELEIIFEEKLLPPSVDRDDDVATVEREAKTVTGLASIFKVKS